MVHGQAASHRVYKHSCDLHSMSQMQVRPNEAVLRAIPRAVLRGSHGEELSEIPWVRPVCSLCDSHDIVYAGHGVGRLRVHKPV